jgi:hypothetical protein
MENQELQPRKSELTVVDKTSLTASEKMLAVEMHLTALNAKSVPELELVAEFSRSFAHFPPAAIQFAFRKWRESEWGFPAISQIFGLCALWTKQQRAEREAAERAQEKRLEDEARKGGQLLDFAELRKKLADLAATKAMPEAERQRREFERGIAERMAKATAPPALTLTPQEIEARREQERIEIERARMEDSAMNTKVDFYFVTQGTAAAAGREGQRGVP